MSKPSSNWNNSDVPLMLPVKIRRIPGIGEVNPEGWGGGPSRQCGGFLSNTVLTAKQVPSPAPALLSALSETNERF